MVVRWASLLLPEVLVRIQFVTTIKPLIIEYLGTPAGKGLWQLHFFYDASNASYAFSKNKKDSRGTLSLITLFPSLRASRKKPISFISGSTSGIPLYFWENVADLLSKLGPVQLLATSQSWKSILQGLEVLKDELIFFPGNCRFNQALNYYLWLRSRKVWVSRIILGKLDPLSLLPPIPLKVIWVKLALGPPPGRVLRFLALKWDSNRLSGLGLLVSEGSSGKAYELVSFYSLYSGKEEASRDGRS
ncbi:hypothetical protein Tco_0697859 [Tanacetum coccineum]